MKVLSKASFDKILYVIQDQNYANVYARLVLELPSIDSSCFAKILMRSDGAEWVTEDELDYRSFSEATEEEKELIAIELENRKKSILGKLNSFSFASNLFTIPSTDQIFFYNDGLGNISVKLTQWGFVFPRSQDEIDVISALLAKPRILVQSQVTVLVRYSDGLPAVNEPFNLLLFGSTVPFKTNNEGHFDVGYLINGKTFAISDGKGNEKSFTVEPTIEYYEVEFPMVSSYDITVSNQEGTLCANFSLLVDGSRYVTNDNGCIRIDDVVLTPKMTIEALHEETGHKEIFKVVRDPEENHFKFVYNERFYSSLDVIARYEDGECLPYFKMKVGMNEFEADEYGSLHIDSLDPDTTIRVASAMDCNCYVDVKLQRGDNKVELVLQRPKEKMVKVCLTNKDGNPLQNMPIKIERKAGDLEGITDAEGCVFFPAALFSDGEELKLICSYKGRMKLVLLKPNKS